jgi:hypothetical protein
VLLHLHVGPPDNFLTERHPTGLEMNSRWPGGNSAALGFPTAPISRPKR